MLAFIHGQVTDLNEDFVVIEVQDIGYKVFMGLRDLGNLEIGQAIKVHTEMVVREDDISVYGFSKPLDRTMFNALRGVSGIGARTAMNIISLLDGREIIQLVIEDNQPFLTKVPGIGKKTAGRIIIELRDRFVKQFGQDYDAGLTEPRLVADPKFDEVRSALANMGYDRREIGEILQRLDPESSLEEMLKQAFLLMAR